MRVGITVTDFSWPAPAAEMGATIARIAERADEAGFDSIWTMDHFFQIRISGRPPESPMPEAYTTLAFMAAHTRRIRLGVAVASVAYRNPGVLVKTATTVDVLSGGRTIFGIGAGAPFDRLPDGVSPRDVETYGLGIPMPPLAERFERLEEALQIAHRMWSGDESPYTGRHYRLERPLNSPNTLQRPHPPIMIGGSGERKTLRLVAQYADMCNLFDLQGTGFRDDLRHKLDVLRRHCDDVGRDYAEIEKTTATLRLDDSRDGLDALLDHLRELAAIGIDHVVIGPREPWTEASLGLLASAVDEIHAIPVAGRPVAAG
ncbi:MAG TPA: LLM class F420-dependent oxidoreductase [Streptosporangiales bacterium]